MNKAGSNRAVRRALWLSAAAVAAAAVAATASPAMAQDAAAAAVADAGAEPIVVTGSEDSLRYFKAGARVRF